MSLTSAYRIAKNNGYTGNQDDFIKFINLNKSKKLSDVPGFNWDLIVELQGSDYAKHIYKIGDQIKDTYTTNNETYTQLWDIVDFRNITYLKITEESDKNGKVTQIKTEQKYNAMILQSHYAFPDEIQFDSSEPNNTNINRSIYGNGNYSLSGVRQYINSDEDNWYNKQHKFDNEPDNQIPGLLKGFSEDFRKILKPIKITTQGNAITENKSLYITYDKLWLPSLDELYFDTDYINNEDFDENSPSKYNVNMNIEGLPFTYWKNKNKKDNEEYVDRNGNIIKEPDMYNSYWYNKLASDNYKIKRLDNNEVTCDVWLRSADLSDTDGAWYINSNGNFNNGDAANTFHYVAPCCAIFKLEEDN